MYLWIELLGYGNFLCLTFWGSAKLFSRVAVLFYSPTSNVWGFQFFSHPHQYLLFLPVFLVIVTLFTHCHVWFFDPMNCSVPGLPAFNYLPEFALIRAQWVSDVIQLSHPLSPPSPPALNLSQHQHLFQWVGSLHQVAKVLESQLQHQSFQLIFRLDFL